MKKVLLMLVGLVLVTGCGCSKKKVETTDVEKGTSNKNSGVIEDKVYDGLTFTNTSLTTIEGKSTLITTVENKTKEDYKLDFFKIILKDSEGNVIDTLLGDAGNEIKTGEVKQIKSSTDKDIKNVVSIEYEVVK